MVDINNLGDRTLVPVELDPGEFRISEVQTTANLVDKRISLHIPAYQNWDMDFSVSLLPEQNLESSSLKIKENVGTWSSKIPSEGLSITWDSQPEKRSPFLTLHKPINSEALDPETLEALNWSDGDLVIELQFSELFQINDIKASLADRNYANQRTMESSGLKNYHEVFPATLLLNFSQSEYQKDERFYLSLEGVTDIWGNEYKNEPRTIITR